MRNNQLWHPAAVLQHRDLTPTVREFEIRPEGGVKPWTVGSHLNLQVFAEGRAETRSYSLVGLPPAGNAAQVYRIAVKLAQPGRGGSRHMWSLEAGADVMIGEPNNHFELPLGAPHYLLIAGGIGITPIIGMAQLLAQRGASLQMMYGARSADEFAFGDVLHQALGERVQTFASEAGQQMNFDAAIAALPAQSLLVMCGPLGMLDTVRAAWARSGRPAANLRFETFGNSGAQANEAFVVKLPRHGVELLVPANRSLLDVLEAHGIETLYDCRRGECGLCAMDIVEVDGTIDHRDVFFSAAEQQSNDRLCACVSRASGCVVLDSAYRPD